MRFDLALVPVAAGLACAALLLVLLKRSVRLPLDHPNERSLHSTPIPRIGGWGIVGGTLLALLLVKTGLLTGVLVGGLFVLSFLDDRAHLPAAIRLVTHVAAATAFVLATLPDVALPTQALLIVAMVWMINLYNFMDGSDGLAGGMALFGFGAYACAAWLGSDSVFAAIAASIAAAALAFLPFNFPPARLFMGDAGSVPLGFLAAALGLLGWHAAYWPLWFPLVVFSPFIVDASATLVRRMARRERFWEAHRTHYYQRLVQLGWGHRKTALAEYALMAGCGAIGLWALGQSTNVQWLMLAAVALSYLLLAALVDAAWRRRRDVSGIDARSC